MALVTGSTNGIGRATAEALAAAGYAVGINSRSSERAEQAARAIGSLGGEAFAAPGDVSTESGARSAVTTSSGHGRLRVLVNNAGIPHVGSVADLELDEWDHVLRTNLKGPLMCARLALPSLHCGGVVVNVSSILGQTAFPLRAAYTASKHALEGLTKVMALEWASLGVRVLSIAPAYVETDLVTQTLQDARDGPVGRTPLGRLARPEEVAAAIVFLASPSAGYMTGSTLTLDGGWLANGHWMAAAPHSTTP